MVVSDGSFTGAVDEGSRRTRMWSWSVR